MFIKKILLLIILGTTLNAFADPAKSKQTVPDKQAIKTVLLAQQNAWNRGDIEAYMQGYWKSDKLRFASGGHYKFGWQATLAGYKKNYPDKTAMGQLNFSIHDINIISTDAALVFGGWQLKRQKDKPHGLFTLLFRKKAEGWKIVADHTSSAAE